MKLIQLTQGQVAMVDDDDYEKLSKWKWCAIKARNGSKKFYAVTSQTLIKNKGSKMIQMHRYILGLTDPKQLVDHKDRNPLNNQKSNLRTCSFSENCSNKQKHKTKTATQYKGVYYKKTKKRNGDGYYENWTAICAKKGIKKKEFLFPYTSEGEIMAAHKYNEMAIEMHGEFACINEMSK